MRVDDLYKDGTTFYKTLVKGVGTASPYMDSYIARKLRFKSPTVKVKVEIDGEVRFAHEKFEKLDYAPLQEEAEEGEERKEEEAVPENEVEKFDFDEYAIPSVVSRILKTTKLKEVVQVRTTRKDKLDSHFDEETKCFKKELLTSFQKECVITFALIGFQQKDYIFKLPIAEKVDRFSHLKMIGTKFFKVKSSINGLDGQLQEGVEGLLKDKSVLQVERRQEQFPEGRRRLA